MGVGNVRIDLRFNCWFRNRIRETVFAVGKVLALLGPSVLELNLFHLVSPMTNVLGSAGQDFALWVVLQVPKPVVLHQIRLESVKVQTSLKASSGTTELRGKSKQNWSRQMLIFESGPARGLLQLEGRFDLLLCGPIITTSREVHFLLTARHCTTFTFCCQNLKAM